MEYSEGLSTHRVPMALHTLNRKRLADQLQADGHSSGLVVLAGAPSVARFDSDHEPFVRQESFFQWAFGAREPDLFGAVDVETGKSVLFIPRLPQEYAVWMGAIRTCEDFRSSYEVDECRYVDELKAYCAEKGKKLLLLHGENTDSKSFAQPASFEGIEALERDQEALFPAIVNLRVIKTDLELDVMRYATRISCEAHCEVMRQIHTGMMEYQVEALFKFKCHFDGGMRHQAYQCICAGGLNGATLHYGHAGAPNAGQLLTGQMALFDMGGEYHCYCSDVTCSFPVDGHFSADQRLVYEAVLSASRAVLSAMKPGVSWLDMHRLAERRILEALLAGGVLQGSLEELEAAHVGALLQPHGLGHLIGLDTHDVGGWPIGTQRPTAPGLCKLRNGRVLAENMAITVEPGCYFIPALLEPAFKDPATQHLLNEPRLRSLIGFGGVRIEDDVIVTHDGCENMSAALPRTVEEIEAFMAKENPHCKPKAEE